ncbi:hypothetical protein QBC39DRAFT_75022 [Podospora conica]|nr:hypothetical protein QBC39DRAFT_75022 [Schizothecium conicum]
MVESESSRHAAVGQEGKSLDRWRARDCQIGSYPSAAQCQCVAAAAAPLSSRVTRLIQHQTSQSTERRRLRIQSPCLPWEFAHQLITLGLSHNPLASIHPPPRHFLPSLLFPRLSFALSRLSLSLSLAHHPHSFPLRVYFDRFHNFGDFYFSKLVTPASNTTPPQPPTTDATIFTDSTRRPLSLSLSLSLKLIYQPWPIATRVKLDIESEFRITLAVQPHADGRRHDLRARARHTLPGLRPRGRGRGRRCSCRPRCIVGFGASRVLSPEVESR